MRFLEIIEMASELKKENSKKTREREMLEKKT